MERLVCIYYCTQLWLDLGLTFWTAHSNTSIFTTPNESTIMYEYKINIYIVRVLPAS